MFWIIMWRNIWARKRQAVLTVALSALCTVFLIFSLAFMNGQHEKMIRDAVEIYTGYIQITGKGFRDHPDDDHLIFDLDNVKRAVSQFPEVKSAGERFETFALFAGPTDSAGGLLIGVRPRQEQLLSRIPSTVVQGEYLNESDQPACLIGQKLADRLNVRLGDELTYISQALDLSMAADRLTVTGIFSTGSQTDADSVFVNKAYMDSVFLTDNKATHYIVLPFERFNEQRLNALVRRLNERLGADETEAVSWKVPLKSLLQLLNVDSAFGYFSYGILVVVIFFVIMIFFLISVFQRTREIGILRAVGTMPGQVFFLLIGEAFLLGMIAVIIGGIAGGALVYYYHVHPIQIDMPREVLEEYHKWGVTDATFPTVFSVPAILCSCLFVLLLNIAAVLYPAVKVNRYKPVDAINYV